MIEYKVKVHNNGERFWSLDGKLHREDGPAVEYASGTKVWYQNGKKHREDGPAIEYVSGSKIWYREGKLHREDGPAFDFINGEQQWYVNGKRHREDGPAVILSMNGAPRYYLDGIFLTEEQHRERTQPTPSCDGRTVTIDGVEYELKLKGN